MRETKPNVHVASVGLTQACPDKLFIYFINPMVSLINKYDNITVVSHSIYIVCVLDATISALLVSDVKPPYQMLLAISTALVISGVPPPTTMSLL